MIKKLLAVLALTLTLTGCAEQRTVEVTPQACIVALDYAGEGFGVLADDPANFGRWVEENAEDMRFSSEYCRSKAVD